MSIPSQISRISQNVSDSLDAVAAKGVTVPSGSTSDDLPELIAAIPTGSGSAITIVDTTDEHGGTIRTITGVSLAGDTVSAAHLERGYTAHDALGNPITGTLSPGGGGGTYQAKTHITPTESSQTITPDTGYDALSSVQIDAIDSEYVGSDIPRRTEDDALFYAGTFSFPEGYYANDVIKFIPSGIVTAPSTISGTSATVSTGTNTLTLSKTVSVTPNVTTAGYISSGTAGNSSVSLTASVTTKAAATYYPSTSDQTVSASQYLTGAQTIKGVVVSGLSTDKILSGTTVKVGDSSDDDRITSVSGSVVIQHYYTGSSAPASNLGVNGDIYLQTS